MCQFDRLILLAAFGGKLFAFQVVVVVVVVVLCTPVRWLMRLSSGGYTLHAGLPVVASLSSGGYCRYRTRLRPV